MKKSLCIILFALLLFSFSAMADDIPPVNSIVMIDEVEAIPGKFLEYEAGIEAMMETMRKTGFEYSSYNYRGSTLNYFTFSPVKDMADIDKRYQAWFRWQKKVGQKKYSEIMKMLENTHYYYKTSIWMEFGGLSYLPGKVEADEGNYIYMEKYWIVSGREMDVANLLMEYAALYKEAKIPFGYKVLHGMIGVKSPVIMFLMRAKDANALKKQEVDGWKMMNKEQKAKRSELQKKLFSYTRRFDIQEAWYLPKGSFVAEEKK